MQDISSQLNNLIDGKGCSSVEAFILLYKEKTDEQFLPEHELPKQDVSTTLQSLWSEQQWDKLGTGY